MASPVDLKKANASFCLALFKELSKEDKTENIFFSPFSISAALAMVMMGAKADTATQMSKVLKFTEPKSLLSATEPKSLCSATPLQSLMQMRSQSRKHMQTQMKMQMQQHNRMPGYLKQVLKSETCKEDKQSDKDGNADVQPSKEETPALEEDPQAVEECPTKQDDIHDEFEKLLRQLLKDDDKADNDDALPPYELNVANRLYGEQSYNFIKEFSEEIKKHYDAELESMDFKGQAEGARVNINNWVEEKTKEKITNLLAEGTVTNMTKMVLVNAIYFKGQWDSTFKATDTADAQFKLTKNETKTVKMMSQTRKFKLREINEKNWKVLEMPYLNGDLSMVIILPDEIEGLEKLEKELTFEKFVEWTQTAKTENVEVKLPKFKMDETHNLKDALKNMGMVDAFDASKSDFTGMSPVNDLVLSNVVHKAYVAVDEEGTEAAAATAVLVSATSVELRQPKKFIADHPFLFFIRHNSTETILFAGRCCSPE